MPVPRSIAPGRTGTDVGSMAKWNRAKSRKRQERRRTFNPDTVSGLRLLSWGIAAHAAVDAVILLGSAATRSTATPAALSPAGCGFFLLLLSALGLLGLGVVRLWWGRGEIGRRHRLAVREGAVAVAALLLVDSLEAAIGFAGGGSPALQALLAAVFSLAGAVLLATALTRFLARPLPPTHRRFALPAAALLVAGSVLRLVVGALPLGSAAGGALVDQWAASAIESGLQAVALALFIPVLRVAAARVEDGSFGLLWAEQREGEGGEGIPATSGRYR